MIYIGCVGKNDPFGRDKSNGYGPTLTLLNHYKPSNIFLFANREMQDYTDLTESEIREDLYTKKEFPQLSHLKIVDLADQDPTNFNELYSVFKKELKQIQKWRHNNSFLVEAPVLVGLSAGTPQMNFVLSRLLEEGILPGAKRVVSRDPNYHDAYPESVYEIEFQFVEASRILSLVGYWFDQYDFARLAEELDRLYPLISEVAPRRQVRDLIVLFQVLNHVDQFQYRKALTHLDSAHRGPLIKDIFPAWSETLQDLNDTMETRKESETYLLDLYHHAKRLTKRNLHAVALSTWWHFYEALVFYRTRNAGIDPSRREDSSNTNLANKEDIQELYKKNGMIARHECERLLKGVLNDKDWKTSMHYQFPHLEQSGEKTTKTFQQWINVLRLKRNNSHAGHGMNAVDSELVAFAEKLMDHLFQKLVSPSPQRYPFSEKNLAPLREKLTSL